MFIDYLPLMLVNMAAGLLVLAFFLMHGIEREDRAKWTPAFGIVGLVALLCGLHMSWTWPLISSYNIAYGETSVMLGAAYLGIAWSLQKGWSPAVVGIYSFLAGMASILLGVRILALGMTNLPSLTCVGYVLSGLGAMLFGPAARAKGSRGLRMTAGIVLILAALIWAMVAGMAYWGHMSGFSKWQPNAQIERQVKTP
jgi:putative membrane protein